MHPNTAMAFELHCIESIAGGSFKACMPSTRDMNFLDAAFHCRFPLCGRIVIPRCVATFAMSMLSSWTQMREICFLATDSSFANEERRVQYIWLAQEPVQRASQTDQAEKTTYAHQQVHSGRHQYHLRKHAHSLHQECAVAVQPK